MTYQDEEQDVDKNHYNLLNLKEGMIFESGQKTGRNSEISFYFLIKKIDGIKVIVEELWINWFLNDSGKYSMSQSFGTSYEVSKIFFNRLTLIDEVPPESPNGRRWNWEEMKWE